MTTEKLINGETKWIAETKRRMEIIKYLKVSGIKRTPKGEFLYKAPLVDLERLYISVKCASV
jgi:hypothetical protein